MFVLQNSLMDFSLTLSFHFTLCVFSSRMCGCIIARWAWCLLMISYHSFFLSSSFPRRHLRLSRANKNQRFLLHACSFASNMNHNAGLIIHRWWLNISYLLKGGIFLRMTNDVMFTQNLNRDSEFFFLPFFVVGLLEGAREMRFFLSLSCFFNSKNSPVFFLSLFLLCRRSTIRNFRRDSSKIVVIEKRESKQRRVDCFINQSMRHTVMGRCEDLLSPAVMLTFFPRKYI